jgi:hypothetical protein
MMPDIFAAHFLQTMGDSSLRAVALAVLAAAVMPFLRRAELYE